ncbi:YiiX/YebB-like N1pC/P60 family cysteine hydrolase [Flavobacterium sp. RHBU_3]|uniref:YiiX/YebB-like N1pC/P60 family cysteine hydrolase n=1 Tax=Flavobacterium sp. RHBU_3 TaxID=3391184 RepID=UPI00398569C0
MRIFTLILFIACSSLYAQNIVVKDLKDGDFIFQDMDCGPLCDAIEAVTEGYNGADFSHMGMVFHRNDTLYVVEAAGSAVRLTPLAKFAKNTTKPMLVARLKKKFAKLIPSALDFSLKQLGVPYDDEYIYDNGAYYCSELIYDAFKHANGGKPFFKLTPMTYKQPDTDEYFAAWVEYYKKLDMPIPEGLPGCNPGGLSRSNKLQVLGVLNL